MPPTRFRHLLLLLFTTALMLPVLALLGAWWPCGPAGTQALGILREMGATVLPDYLGTTLWLCLLVTVGVIVVGLSTAAAVTLFDFPGRRFFEWALLLPLAMPAYVVAYAYTDFLQYSGPFQTWLRAATGWEGRVFPEVRNTAGAAWVMTFTLYPYVYLLTRTALAERATHLMEAARLLGAPLGRRVREVALPLARPAVAAGVALALMETLADFGVASYFGIQTFTAGIYKAWLAMDNRIAAAQLATLLLGFVALLLWLEHRSRARLRFVSARLGRAAGAEAQPVRLQGWQRTAAWAVCALPILMGFLAPVLFMLRPLVGESTELPWDRFWGWAGHSVRLGLLAAVLAVGLALLLAYALRRLPDALTRGVVRLASLGYAVPGAVIVVGLLLPVGWVQARWPQAGAAYWVTATSLGLIWAYLVRFVAVALQSVQSGYARIPANLDDSARLLGSGSWGLLSRVHWPLLRRPVLAATLLVFVDVMKELPATLVLRPFDSDTLAVVTYQLARDERLGEAALPALALVLVGLIPVLLLSRTLRGRSG
ncbi:MAG: ABC transporter permease [Hylemonella sp.]|uniref:ABC transporter permease n=1 Tax=Hylemonella sp. TaxID=2066020 RepID=UPI003918DAF5